MPTSPSLSQPLLALTLFVLAFVASMFAATSAGAAEGGAFYRAELAQPAETQSVIVDGLVWRCDGSACYAAKSNSRDAIVCARLVKKIGPVTGFASRQGALEGEQLARCNKG